MRDGLRGLKSTESGRLVPGDKSGYTTSIVRRHWFTPIGLLLLALAGLTGCAGPAVSPTDQVLLRETDQLQARLEPAVVERQEPRLRRYLEQLSSRIVTAARELDQQGVIQSRSEGSNEWLFSKDIDFHLVKSELPNIYTGGGRHIYIYDGLFQQCRNEDELASLFCHEYAHVYARHAQKELKRSATAGGNEDDLLEQFVTLKFTPAHEKTAETIAFNIFVKAGWDPARYADLYRRLLQQGPPGELDAALLRERVEAVHELPAGAQNWAQPPVADDARFAQLQAETQAVVTATPRNDRVELLLAAFPNCLTPPDSPVQVSARQRLFPPPAVPSENKWNKGLQGAR
jgi:predicted Zn-dependent protease